MSFLFKKKLRPVGLPPGSLENFNNKHEDIHLSVIEYSEDQFIEKHDISIETCLEHLDTPTMTWVEVSGVPNASTVAAIGKHFNFHPLILEDILTTGQRSKLDLFQDQVFIIVRFLQYNEKTNELQDQQASIVFGPNYLISFFECREDIFKPIKDRLRQGGSRIRKEGADYLAYALLDTIVDYYLVLLEKVDATLDSLEEELSHFPKPTTLHKIQHTKRVMVMLRKAIWPMRDVINRFMHLEGSIISPTTLIYIRDIYDHTVQTIDIIEGFRDVVSGMLDIYLSNINIRTNDIMKVLTIVSTIFVPLTFICSIYGMNFDYMPELRFHWGYPIVLIMMLSIAIAMLFFFRRKRWI
jgi:magnesium transporter